MTINTTNTEVAITANVSALHMLIRAMSLQTEEAMAAARQGESDQALGILAGILDPLTEAIALYRAAAVLNRSRHQAVR